MTFENEVEVSLGERVFAACIKWSQDGPPEEPQLIWSVDHIYEITERGDYVEPAPALTASEMETFSKAAREAWDAAMESAAERAYERRMDR
jgi:hypothetical protein